MQDHNYRIVDAHHHLWDIHGNIRYPWLTHDEWAFMGDYCALKRDYLPPEYKRDSALHNVVGTVAIEAECDRSQQVEEALWFAKMAQQHGMPNAIVAHAWVDTPQTEEILARLCEIPLVRGIRSKPVISSGPGDQSVRGKPRSMQDPAWIKGVGLFQQYGLSFDLRLPWWHLEEGAEVASMYPDLQIVLNHTGYPWDRRPASLEIWRKGMHEIAKRPNVHCKVSGLCVPGQPWTDEANIPIIQEAIQIFGPERCMFASNFPVDGLKVTWDRMYCTFKQAIKAYSPKQQQDMLADNAIRFYRLSL